MLRFLILFVAITAFANDGERTTIVLGDQDTSLKVDYRGRAANVELAASGEATMGYAITDYQKGRGYANYDRSHQSFTFKSKINYTLNRWSKHIQKVAPYQQVWLPRDAVIDFNMKTNTVGFGSLNFEHLQLSDFFLDVSYGDLDVHFPSENTAIMRDTAVFKLTAGDLEIYKLGNLKATDIKINGGTGELNVDFGPKLHKDTNVKLDLDIGATELSFPKGTRVIITGTSRDLAPYGFEKVDDKTWQPVSYHEASPTLSLKLKGPLGDLTILWQ